MCPIAGRVHSGCWASRSGFPRRAICIRGLEIACNHQFGKAETADWLGGEAAGVQRAERGRQLHVAASGSVGAPIYASIDDNPSFGQYKQQVAPYLRGWEAVVGKQCVGVYGNSEIIESAFQDGLGSWFWQHN